MALIQGYDKLGFEVSLAKPFLRKEMEVKMKAICAGSKNKRDVVHEVIEQYREVYTLAALNVSSLKETVKRYVVDQDYSDVRGGANGISRQ
jgi:DNA topoisomerase III